MMKVELLGALDYNKVEKVLKEFVTDKEDLDRLIEELKEIERIAHSEKVATAGRLSRFAGDVFEVLGISEDKTLEQNAKYAAMVTGMGHDSIADHDYGVFLLKDVSIIVEQTIIAERYSSYTVKSRREVDHSKEGFYTPDFHDISGKVLSYNKDLKRVYNFHMRTMFDFVADLVKKGIKPEDSRFALPYCFYCNIMMGMDTHTLKNLIIKLLKTKYSKIQELREFGEQLLEIAKVNFPYIIEEIENTPYQDSDLVEDYLNEYIPREGYKILDKPELLNYSGNVDETIIISAIMRRYQLNKEQAIEVYSDVCQLHPEFPNEMMKLIAFKGDSLELTQVNFRFQFALSYAVLTHLTRHRAHDIIIPDFCPIPDLTQYKTPPSIAKRFKTEYDQAYAKNLEMFNKFKNEYHVREEDLVHFILSGNMTNVVTNINGKSLQHILGLRTCNKTQWETREWALNVRRIISELDDCKYYSQILGPTCETQGICNEGKECCGKIYTLKK